MAKKLISYDDEAEGLGLPEVVEQRLNDTYGAILQVDSLEASKLDKVEAANTYAPLADIFDGGPLKHAEVTLDPFSSPSRDGTLLLLLKPPPTQFFTDFSEHTVGAPPQGWSPRWKSVNAFTVEPDPSAMGGVVLQESPLTDEYANRAFSWDAIGEHTDVETVCRWKADQATVPPRLAVRGSGTDLPTAYHGGAQNETTNTLSKAVSSTSSVTLGTEAYEFMDDTWYITRLRAVGDTIASKTWLASDPEPTTWDFEVQDTSIPGPGWVGLRIFPVVHSRYIDWFGVGIEGDSAPMQAVDS